MRLSPTVLTDRFRAVADRLARGSAVPAGTDPVDAETRTKGGGSRERGAMRRRLREQRKLRDALLLELGALVMEAQRHGRDDAAVVRTKAAEAAAVDAEARALADTLSERESLDTLLSTGVAGACFQCGSLTSTRARFCQTCGADLGAPPVASAPLPLATEHVNGDGAATTEVEAAEPEADPAEPEPAGQEETAR